MTVDEFLSRGKAQTPVVVQREVAVHGPELQRLLAQGKPMLLSEVMAHPDQRREMRTFRYAHVFGLGITDAEIDAWQASYPNHPLPADLKRLLNRVNGIDLWADLDTSHAYFGILPLEKWHGASSADWAMMFDKAPVGLMVLSGHDNGDNYLVLDTHHSQYLWYDLEDFDNPKEAGRSVEELLDFWWLETAWLDPRRPIEVG